VKQQTVSKRVSNKTQQLNNQPPENETALIQTYFFSLNLRNGEVQLLIHATDHYQMDGIVMSNCNVLTIVLATKNTTAEQPTAQ
jgi:hypothetical protein